MRIHYLQHVAFEGPGHIADWATNQGHVLSSTALFTDEPLPHPDSFDLLVIMGGPMGIYDTDQYAWLTREKHFIENMFRKKKQILGICLGAQLMADVLGARVYQNTHKEIGWYPVTRIIPDNHFPWSKIVPEEFFAFHWHGDTFELPQGAFHLAQSQACRHQAFYYPPSAIGLQFHLEASQESIGQLIRHCGHEIVSAPYIQSETDIRNQDGRIFSSNTLMGRILDFFQEKPIKQKVSD